MREYAIIEAPSPLGLRPDGVQELAGALLNAGLADLLGARRAGKVEPPRYDFHRDPETGFLNTKSIADYSVKLSECVGKVLDRHEFPIVLGGDCSILLGNLLALRRRGRFGLLFIDGHTDFYQAAANINGEIASSELAIATGREPQVLAYMDEQSLVRDRDVVAFGFRDEEEEEKYGSQPLPPEMLSLNLAAIRDQGIETATSQALVHLQSAPAGFWMHLDADALDDSIMPAVDYRLEDGLSWQELQSTMRAALLSGRCVGLNIAIFNPRLDKRGKIARQFVDVLAKTLRH